MIVMTTQVTPRGVSMDGCNSQSEWLTFPTTPLKASNFFFFSFLPLGVATGRPTEPARRYLFHDDAANSQSVYSSAFPTVQAPHRSSCQTPRNPQQRRTLRRGGKHRVDTRYLRDQGGLSTLSLTPFLGNCERCHQY